MSFDDIVNKGKDAANSEQGEQVTDQGLQGASDFASNATGGKFDDQINQGREAADGAIGQQGQGGQDGQGQNDENRQN